ncbi:MAG: hypothetical protein RLZ23_414 [Actinomycetota bacterium]
MKIKVGKKQILLIGAVIVAIILINRMVNTIPVGNDSLTVHFDNSSSAATNYTADEVMFAKMMIPHHQQAIEMSDMALTTSTNPLITALAQQIRDAQAPEVEEMKMWFPTTGMDSMMDDMPMSGMLTDSELETLRASTGKAFDRLFLTSMIGHHEGALEMVKLISDSKNKEVKTLAANIVKSQSAEIALMKKYLSEM